MNLIRCVENQALENTIYMYGGHIGCLCFLFVLNYKVKVL